MNPVPTIVISDPEVLARLAAAEGPIILRGPKGECLRMAELVPPGKLPAGFKSPISDEEFEEARKQPDGLPLSEVWKKIHERYGS